MGEQLATMPVWPVFRRSQNGLALQAWAFETIDIEPIPGYGGKPINLLVVIDPAGRFLDLELLSHAEPIFRSPAGTAILAEFAAQYKDLSINHRIEVLGPKVGRRHDEHTATLHGVTAGTVTVTAMNRSILEAAAQVAYARLDDPDIKKQAAWPLGLDDRYRPMGWKPLVAAGLAQRISRTNRELERRFAGTPFAGRDPEGIFRPDVAALDMWVILAGLPQAGRNLLDAGGWRQVRELRESGIHVIAVLDEGRYRAVGSREHPEVRAARLVARQAEREFDLREVPYAHGMRLSAQRSGVAADAALRLFATEPGAGLDLLRPITLELHVSRPRGDASHPPMEVRFDHDIVIPNVAAWQPVRDTPAWLLVWEQRRADLAILALGLTVLTAALALQRWLSATQPRLTSFRVLYLAFTLGFVGWKAQGQLTIVNLTSMGGALISGQGADFLLSDPIAVVLWAFVGVTLLIWGRGTFCGWLCPFGALQELLSLLARRMGLRKSITLPTRVDVVLKGVKYLVLAAIAGAVLVESPWTDRLVEVEPFKTSISMGFQREWPYVAWAVACLALGLFVFRGYCRYLCPLGAALAVVGRLRLWSWIPRHTECGTPCQTCRHRCAYQAIDPRGRIDYAECFQCLDCVSLHQDATRCLPLILERKGRGEVMPIQVAVPGA